MDIDTELSIYTMLRDHVGSELPELRRFGYSARTRLYDVVVNATSTTSCLSIYIKQPVDLECYPLRLKNEELLALVTEIKLRDLYH